MRFQDEVREFIVSQYLKNQLPEGFNDDFDLIESGVMDSLAIISVIEFIEKKTEIQIDDGDIVPDNFASISAVCKFVASKQAEPVM